MGGQHTLGGSEVNDVAVRLEHVDLLDGLDGLGVELLQGLLELLVISAGASGCALDLATGSALATIKRVILAWGFSMRVSLRELVRRTLRQMVSTQTLLPDD